jgi:SAM-dependent methyltransferase
MMSGIHGTSFQQDKYNAFWNRMASHYPDPFNPETLSETNDVISIVKNRGVKISQSSILDIGCGAGTYTLPLASEAAMVTGLDDSDVMIERLSASISSSGLQNVRPVKASWKDIEISRTRFEKAFDIVWTSMTPAVRTLEDFSKMERCSKRWCVYIGWGGKRKNRLMEEVFELHGLKFGPPPGVGAAYDILVQSGRTPSIDYFETSWDWTGKVDDALEDMECFIEMQGAKADRSLIETALDRYEREGMVSHTTHAKEGVMVWRVS